jgi:hypothetical protein
VGATETGAGNEKEEEERAMRLQTASFVYQSKCMGILA